MELGKEKPTENLEVSTYCRQIFGHTQNPSFYVTNSLIGVLNITSTFINVIVLLKKLFNL